MSIMQNGKANTTTMIIIERVNEAISDPELIGNYSILIHEQVIKFKNVIIRVRIRNF